MRLDHLAQPYSPTGSMAGAGVTNLLGTPTIDALTTLVRESVQNTWDARLDEGDPGPGRPGPEWRAHFRRLLPSQQVALREALPSPAEADAGPHSLSKALREAELPCVEISDWGTKGLGGPTDPQQAVARDDVSDYVDFLFNTGSPRDVHHGGGTYGFGKAAYFLMSECRTIIVHSRTDSGSGDRSERLIGLRIGEDYTLGGARFTGRHWWGASVGERIDPLFGDHAAALASELGLPSREAGATGTTILVVGAALDGRDLHEFGGATVRTLLWNFWPKLNHWEADDEHRSRLEPHMRFSVRVEGQDVDVPDPRTIAPLDLFCEVHASLLGQVDSEATPITWRTKANVVGRLQHQKSLLNRVEFEALDRLQASADESGEKLGSAIPEVSRHVALMRPAELVVRYLEGPAPPISGSEYAGVFICSDEHESTFASSEPPAHDDWIPDSLEGDQRSQVRTALRKVKEEMREIYGAVPVSATEATGAHLGSLSSLLGSALFVGGGHGASIVAEERKPGRAKRKKPRLQTGLVGIAQFQGLELFEGQRHARFLQEVVPEKGKGIELAVEVKIAITGGTESPESLGLNSPVPRWRTEESSPWSKPQESLMVSSAGKVQLLVELPGDMAIQLLVRERKA